MARKNFVKSFDLCIEIPYSTIICSQHIYKTIWIAVVGLELIAKSNVRKEALDYDDFQLLYLNPKKKKKKNEHNWWFGACRSCHIEISSLRYYFLETDKDNTIHVKVTGDQKREIGFIVPGKYSERTNPWVRAKKERDL